MDDLGSATYDVFERDPVKYRQYEEVCRVLDSVCEVRTKWYRQSSWQCRICLRLNHSEWKYSIGDVSPLLMAIV